MMFTEEQLRKIASPISETEQEKGKQILKMVRDAMKKLKYTDDNNEIRTYVENTYAYTLNMRQGYSGNKITLLVQGSYANKTNIPNESDMDIAVILESTFTANYRSGALKDNYGFTDGTFSIATLKNDVEKVLKQCFGAKNVERHDKSIKVYECIHHIYTDVVVAYRYRDYSNDLDNDSENYIGGIHICSDSGVDIINYPELHIIMGFLKNQATKYNFKKCVRIAKNMREKMRENGYFISDLVSSFGIESLFWNVDDSAYTKYWKNITYTFGEVISILVEDFTNFDTYKEVNAINPLFSDVTIKKAYQKFISDMKNFYEYII